MTGYCPDCGNTQCMCSYEPKGDSMEYIKNCEHSNDSDESHICPYKAEIGDDTETLCNCCDDCRTDCAQDI